MSAIARLRYERRQDSSAVCSHIPFTNATEPFFDIYALDRITQMALHNLRNHNRSFQLGLVRGLLIYWDRFRVFPENV